MAAFSFESSGKIIPPSAQELAQADKQNYIIAFTKGVMEDETAFYAYIAVQPSRYQQFYRRTAAGETFALSEYGTVIAYGFEENPPPEVVRYMRDAYGFDEEYEEKLATFVRGEQAEFLKGQEDKRIMDIVATLKKASGDTNAT